MRYLYGDSTPFPLQYNFLTTLDAFVTCAARVVELQHEGQRLVSSTVDASVARKRSLDELEGFHRAVMAALRDQAMRATGPTAAEYARQLAEHASRIVEDHRQTFAAANDREQAQARGVVDHRRAEIRAAFETFLTVGRLPVEEFHVTLRLDGGQNELAAVFMHPLGVLTSFKLSTASAPAWQVPRKVSEFAQGVELQIGIKKSWITRKVQPEILRLDEFIVSGFELGEETAQLRLRKKPDLKDSFVFNLQRLDTELIAEVQRPEDEMEGMSPHLDAADRTQLEGLWQLLRLAVADVLHRKERLVTAKLDGADIFEQDLVIQFVERLVRMFAPTVAEIVRRSSNKLELSLKEESDAGRREELYLRKLDLAKRIEPLSIQGRAIFAPLGLLPADSGMDITVED